METNTNEEVIDNSITFEEPVTLEKLPMHELRTKAKERGLIVARDAKKVDVIKVLETGEQPKKEREVKRMPTLQSKATSKSIALLPKNFEQIISTKYPQLRVEIDEDSNCINFLPRQKGDRSVIPQCVNIDVPERHIFKAAEDAVSRTGNSLAIADRNNVQAMRIDQEKLEREKLEADIKAHLLQG